MRRDFREGSISGRAGVGVFTDFDVRIGRITYGYDVFKDKKKEFGILAGLHVTQAKVKLQFSGDLTIDGVGSVSAETSRRIACDASRVAMAPDATGRIPAVGRKTRALPPGLRRALDHRDWGCRFPGF